MHTSVYAHESARVGKYDSSSVGLDVKVFRPTCGPGQQGGWVDVWELKMPTLCPSREGQSQAWGRPAETQFSTRTAKSLSFSLPQRRRRARSPRAQRPISTNPAPLCARGADRHQEPRPAPLKLSPAPRDPGASTPAAPARLLPARRPQLQPVCALVCAAGLNPNDDSRAEPGKEEAGRRIQNPCT